MSDKAVGWVRQAPGKALEWLGGIDTGGSTGYNPGLKSRLSITKDNSKSQVSLSVSSVTTEDSATYYCTTVHQYGKPNYGGYGYGGYGCYGYGYAQHYVDAWGQGLLVTVSSEGESHPR
nr:immunoglobulin mu heavy chain [Bos taurus]